MGAPAPGASGQYSRSTAASEAGPPLPAAVRALLILLGVAGAGLLIVSEFEPLLQVSVGVEEPKVVKDEVIGHEQHAYGLLVLGIFALVILGVLARAMASRSGGAGRPAMLALGAVGLIVLLLALVRDLPDVHRTGLIGERYENATATPELGFYLETLGAVVLLLTAGLLLLLTVGRKGQKEPASHGQGQP